MGQNTFLIQRVNTVISIAFVLMVGVVATMVILKTEQLADPITDSIANTIAAANADQ